MAGFFCRECYADDINNCYCERTGDRQMSEPKTWGDVIEYQEPINRCSGYYGVKDTWPRLVSVGLVARAAASNGVQGCASLQGISPDHVRIVLRWLRRDRPPLTDPIPPETPEPVVVTKVVRWEPTEEDARKIVAAMTHWIDSGDDHRRETAALIDAITDCQANIPDPEPTTPPDPIASIETLNEQVTRLSRSVQSHHCRLDTINARLAALESRDQTPSREWLMQAAEAEDASRSVSVGGLASDLGLYATPVPATPPPHWQGRLVYDFSISGSSPVVRGTRVTADHIVSLIVDGWTWSDILRSHPELTEDDLRACLLFATEADESLLTSPLSSVNGNQTPASNLIGKAPYNTPTTFEEAVKSEPAPPQASGPAVEETPLPGGYKAILDERFSELCVEWTGRIATRRGQRSPSSVVKDLAFLDSPFLVHVVDQCRLALKVFGSDLYDEAKLEASTPPPTPEPVIPLPDGCTEIEGFPLLCKDKEGRDWTRSGYLVLPWGRHEVARMKSRGHSDAEIKQAARYAIREIARDAGLNVVVTVD